MTVRARGAAGCGCTTRRRHNTHGLRLVSSSPRSPLLLLLLALLVALLHFPATAAASAAAAAAAARPIPTQVMSSMLGRSSVLGGAPWRIFHQGGGSESNKKEEKEVLVVDKSTTDRRRNAAALSSPSPPSPARKASAAASLLANFRPSLPALHVNKTLTFWGNMLAGAVSRSCAQTAMHPANVVKTLLQTKGSAELSNLNFKILTRGAGAQFALSLPHGALAFAVLEATKTTLSSWFPVSFAGPAFDFVSSAVSTTLCSVISTPQMVLTDRIMAGYYPNLVAGVSTVLKKDGVAGLYAGWFAALAQKIPSYGLTWVFFQQLKQARTRLMDHEATNTENFGMGALAAAATVCVMIPLDTVKTRIVTQAANPMAGIHYKGVADCFMRVWREEGLKTFYAPLAPRLVSVVPMIGIQFGVYEFMKRTIAKLPEKEKKPMPAGSGWGKKKEGKKVPSVAPEVDSPLSQPPLSELFDEIEDQV